MQIKDLIPVSSQGQKNTMIIPWQLSRCCREWHKGCNGTTAAPPSCQAARSIVTLKRGPILMHISCLCSFFLGAISILCGCQAVTSDRFGLHVQAERCGLVATSDDSCVVGITAARQELVWVSCSLLLWTKKSKWLIYWTPISSNGSFYDHMWNLIHFVKRYN